MLCTVSFDVWDAVSRSLGSDENMYNVNMLLMYNIYIYTKLVDEPLDLVNRVVKS